MFCIFFVASQALGEGFDFRNWIGCSSSACATTTTNDTSNRFAAPAAASQQKPSDAIRSAPDCLRLTEQPCLHQRKRRRNDETLQVCRPPPAPTLFHLQNRFQLFIYTPNFCSNRTDFGGRNRDYTSSPAMPLRAAERAAKKQESCEKSFRLKDRGKSQTVNCTNLKFIQIFRNDGVHAKSVNRRASRYSSSAASSEASEERFSISRQAARDARKMRNCTPGRRESQR